MTLLWLHFYVKVFITDTSERWKKLLRAHFKITRIYLNLSTTIHVRISPSTDSRAPAAQFQSHTFGNAQRPPRTARPDRANIQNAVLESCTCIRITRLRLDK